MESLYHSTNRSLREAQDMMLSLESLAYKADDAGGEFNAAQREVQRRVEQIDSDCQRLDVLANKEPVTRRQNAKIRVEQLKQDVRHLQAALRSVAMKHVSRMQEDRNREQLLTMRFTTNAASRSPMQGVNGSDTSLLIDRALEHHGDLDRSNRGVDDLLDQGQAMLETLRDQRETYLKGFQRKMKDIAATVGMSTTVMGLVQRRQEGDKYVLFGGMVATCIVMLLVYKFLT